MKHNSCGAHVMDVLESRTRPADSVSRSGRSHHPGYSGVPHCAYFLTWKDQSIAPSPGKDPIEEDGVNGTTAAAVVDSDLNRLFWFVQINIKKRATF